MIALVFCGYTQVFKELMSIAKTHMKCSSNDVSLKLLEPMDNLLLPR